MKFLRLAIFIGCILTYVSGRASSVSKPELYPENICLVGAEQFVQLQQSSGRPSPLLKIFKKKQANNRRLTAALIAFPFPFGIVGLHRIYLGCAPYVPVVYIASLGGAFGLLPFIDCVVLLADKNLEKYENNTSVFMWID